MKGWKQLSITIRKKGNPNLIDLKRIIFHNIKDIRIAVGCDSMGKGREAFKS